MATRTNIMDRIMCSEIKTSSCLRPTRRAKSKVEDQKNIMALVPRIHKQMTIKYLKVGATLGTDDSNSPIDPGEQREIMQQCKFIAMSVEKPNERSLFGLKQLPQPKFQEVQEETLMKQEQLLITPDKPIKKSREHGSSRLRLM